MQVDSIQNRNLPMPSPTDERRNRRTLIGWLRNLTFAACISLSAFQVWTAAFGILAPQYQRGIHYAFILFLLFIFYRPSVGLTREGQVPWFDILLAFIAVGVNLYPVYFISDILMRAGDYSNLDGYISLALIVLTLEGARRVIGWPLVIISIIALLYARFGYLIPGYFGHRGFDILTISTHSVLSLEGVMSVPIAVASTFIYIFILFSSFLRISGLGKFFIDVAVSLVGRARGGPAQVAVISSGLLGTISGSCIANVVGTGSFTIPMMKSIGYKPHFAAGIEAAASTGGQLMPPIMGAAAFIMVEFTGISYLNIALAAAVPAILYYLALGIMVYKEAVKTGLQPLPDGGRLIFKRLMKENGHLILPIVIVIFVLIIGYTPLFSGLMGVISCYLVSFFKRSTRIHLRGLFSAMRQAAEDAIPITAACACCGIIIGVVTLTGVGLKIGYGIITLAGGYLFFTLVLTMITSLILGMGVPTTANYIITSTVAAPALVMLKVPTLAAHMFVFYFGIIADITPPVAVASYAAAGLARSDPIKTALTGTRLAIVAFLVPYFFVYNPFLLFIELNFVKTIVALGTSLVAILALGTALSGFWQTGLKMWERFILLVASLALLDQGFITDMGGLGLIAITWFSARYRKRRTHMTVGDSTGKGAIG
jgi:TRAP transporter 4TM/12TM fusion protein